MATDRPRSAARWILLGIVAVSVLMWGVVIALVLALQSIDDPFEWVACTADPPPAQVPGEDHWTYVWDALTTLVDVGEVELSPDELRHVLLHVADEGGAQVEIRSGTLDVDLWMSCETPGRWMHLSTKGRYEVSDGRVVLADADRLDIGPMPFAWLGPKDVQDMLDESLVELRAEDPLFAAVDDLWFVDGHMGLSITAESQGQLAQWMASFE